jgi:superfamily II DNA/RNA helicase
MLRGIRDLSKSFHKNISIQLRGKFKKSGDSITYSYSDSLVSQRRKVENEWEKELEKELKNELEKSENEWNDDEHEQRRIFDQREQKEQKEQREQKEEETFKCEITNKPKRPSTVDCNCEYGCMAKMSETFIIHYEGGVGIISKK